MWWLRTRRSTAWLAWVAAGGAAAGFHIVTLLLLPLAPLFFVTQRRVHWKQAVLLVLGCVLIVSGPAGYYGMFNRWTEKSGGGWVPGVANEPAPDANWGASGLNWLGQGDSGAAEGFTSLSAYLTAYEWMWVLADVNGVAGDVGVDSAECGCIDDCGMLGFVVVGAIPWGSMENGKWKMENEGEGRGRWWRRVWRRMFMDSARSPLVRGSGGERARSFGPPLKDDVSLEPWWRVVLWLLLWIVLPAYGFFYLRSFDDPASPRDWLASVGGLWGAHWIWLVLVMIGLAAAGTRWRIVGLVSSGVVAFFVVLVCVLTACGEIELAAVLDHRLFLWVALIVAPAAIWSASGSSIRKRVVKLLQLVMVVGFVLLLCGGAHVIWGQLREASKEKSGLVWQTIWHTRYVGIVWPAVWIGVAGLIARVPIRAVRWVAIVGICGVNLVNGIARSVEQTQVPYDRALADVWLSQPGSGTRTYFDLNEGVISFVSGGGMPSGAYWKPIAAYDACLAGRIKTTPGDFRVGKTWPFEYGAVMQRFESAVVYRPYTDGNEIVEDVRKTPEVRRVIVWETTHNEGAETDGLARRLGAGWGLAHEDVVQVWWYWDWSPRSMFRRREFVKG